MPFNVVEPHPSVPKSTNKMAYLSTGRGGAGNFSSHKGSALTDGPSASGPASKLAASAAPTKPKSKFISGGIGGAGNFAPAAERRMFSFDEELERQQRLEAARSSTPVYHFGRGGAGNMTTPTQPRTGSTSSASSANSAVSSTSATSAEAGAARLGSRFGKVVRALSNNRE